MNILDQKRNICYERENLEFTFYVQKCIEICIKVIILKTSKGLDKHNQVLIQD